MARVASFGLLASGFLACATLQAAADPLSARYDIMVGGLVVGKANISGDVGPKSYSLSLNASMTGLIGAVTGGKGAASSSGRFNGGRAVSGGYALRASNGSQSRTIRIPISGGNAAKPVVAPPFVASTERAPVTDQHRRGVIDPLSALLMPVKGGDPFDKSNCNRTLPVFDGAQRFDVKLSFARFEEVSVKGYKGPVLVCSARYTPIGGHFPKRPATKLLMENRDLSAWLAPIEGGSVLAPVQINVKTAMGMMTIEARSFPGAQGLAPTASLGQ
jgi:hypothetical protein